MTDLKQGDRVRHWFAGDGTVKRIGGKQSVWVRWDKCGTTGGAYASQCRRIAPPVGDSK